MVNPRQDGWYKELVIRFEDGKEEQFFIEMTTSGTFLLTNLESADWTRLKLHKCSCCPLGRDQEYCPAAESLENTLMRFRDHYSYEAVEAVAIDGARRRTMIDGTLQEVGSVFVQLAVFSSGCPIGKRLRPLLNDTRPFATNNELTRYLISKILLKNRGNVEKARTDIKDQIEPLHEIFSNLWKRLTAQTSGGDAVQNAIVRMDAFTMNVSLVLDEILEELVSDMGWKTTQTKLKEPPPKPADQQNDGPSEASSFFSRLKALFGGKS